MSVLASPRTSETFDGRRPVLFRRRMQSPPIVRACRVYVFEREIFWQFEDTGETFRTEAFLEGHPWFYPIELTPWETGLVIPRTEKFRGGDTFPPARQFVIQQ